MSMFEELKRFVELCLKHRKQKYLLKQINKYIEMKKTVTIQQVFVNRLIDEYNKTYGENLQKI